MRPPESGTLKALLGQHRIGGIIGKLLIIGLLSSQEHFSLTAEDLVIARADKMSNVARRMCPPPSGCQSPCAAGPKIQFTLARLSSIRQNQTFHQEDSSNICSPFFCFHARVAPLARFLQTFCSWRSGALTRLDRGSSNLARCSPHRDEMAFHFSGRKLLPPTATTCKLWVKSFARHLMVSSLPLCPAEI